MDHHPVEPSSNREAPERKAKVRSRTTSRKDRHPQDKSLTHDQRSPDTPFPSESPKPTVTNHRIKKKDPTRRPRDRSIG